ncbi:MAG: molybdenum cofactor guanylyltransferase [Rhizomicrobium sp.]
MSAHSILGVILAGGASRRFGAEKSAAMLGGKPLLAWVAECATPQVDALLLNTNSPEIGQGILNLGRLPDGAPGEGPIAGILAALAEAERRGFTHVASFACDTPFFPSDTVARLAAALDNSGDYAVACCNGAVHRIFALWPAACHARIEEAFASGTRSMGDIEQWLSPVLADLTDQGRWGGNPFFNINTPEDLATAERWLAGRAF